MPVGVQACVWTCVLVWRIFKRPACEYWKAMHGDKGEQLLQCLGLKSIYKPHAKQRQWHKAIWYVIFNFYFHDPSSNPLSPRIFVVCFLHSKPLLAVWIQNSECITGKHTKHLGLAGSLPGAQGRNMSEKAVKTTLWSSCSMRLCLKWILSKTEAHHVVTVLSPLSPCLSIPSLFLLLPGPERNSGWTWDRVHG